MKPVNFRDHDILVVGETFVEFRCDRDIAVTDSYQKSVGGSDIYTAVTAARLGSAVCLVSAIAHDPFHHMVRDQLLSFGVNIDHVITCKGYNGIYFASSFNPDEREYLFHRPGSAGESITPAMIYDDLIENSKMVYGSSELQSVSKAARHAIFKAFQHAHRNDIMVAYDPNLRLQRWSLDDAKESLWGVLPLIDVIFPSAPDESKALFGYERPLDVIGFLWDRGVSIVAVKNGPQGCLVGYDGKIREFHPADPDERPRDLTMIGSIFNGAFLHSIAHGDDPFTAAEYATAAAQLKVKKGGGLSTLPAKDEMPR
jgi:2-dehydro-3-deoxygluconokinase